MHLQMYEHISRIILTEFVHLRMNASISGWCVSVCVSWYNTFMPAHMYVFV